MRREPRAQTMTARRMVREGLPPLGLAQLIVQTGVSVPTPAVQSFAEEGPYQLHYDGQSQVGLYPPRPTYEGTRGAMQFALKHEPIDLRVWVPVLRSLGSEVIVDWMRDTPNSAYARRAWYLWETFVGDPIDVPDAQGNYRPLARGELQYLGQGVKSERHKIVDNLLGTRDYCPLVRRTPILEEREAIDYPARVEGVVRDVAPDVWARAVDYLYTKETKSSFAIEREEVSSGKTARFLRVLREAHTLPWFDEAALTALQNLIVDPRYAQTGYRTSQIYVGQTLPNGRERIHLAAAKPADLDRLMSGWRETITRTTTLPAVAQAAVMSFGFVFIHPFEDGNGRIHRFLIHASLARREYFPSGVVVPISASMLRNPVEYDRALEAFSTEATERTEYEMDRRGEMTVLNETADLFRYWDATPQVEYLYKALDDAIEKDLKTEVEYLVTYDEAFRALTDVVDMPDRRAELLLKLIYGNGGKLSLNKRKLFPELTDDEITRIEGGVASARER